MARSFQRRPARVIGPPDVMPRPLPRTYLVADTLEPFFLNNAARWVSRRESVRYQMGGEQALAHRHDRIGGETICPFAT
jgi:hypothetical protein